MTTYSEPIPVKSKIISINGCQYAPIKKTITDEINTHVGEDFEYCVSENHRASGRGKLKIIFERE